MLRQQAVKAGAHFFYEHQAEGLLGNLDAPLEGIVVDGLRMTDRGRQQTTELHADVTVDATGYRSVLRTGLTAAAAINRPYTKGDLAAVFRTVRQLDTAKTAQDYLTDHYRYGAYRGYFWTHKHHPDVIDVGGGVKEAPDRVNPRDIVEEMIRQRPSITAEELRGGGGTVLVGRSPYSLAASGFLAVGDAAGQVIPTTGCGVGGAMVGAMLAARTIIAALEQNNTRIDALWPYNRMWFGGPGRGNHFAALAALKEILQDLSHAELAFLMRRDILSGEMLTPSINGIFEVPDINATLKTLIRGIARPGLLLQLNRATTMGKKIFRHYSRYPTDWDGKVFAAWVKKADELFGRIIPAG
jgi:flavin-dependent dehydrogenase